MPRNYDSSQPARPYIRVTDLALSYDQRQNALVGYTDQRAMITDDGAVEHLAGPDAQRRGAFSITSQMWGQAIPMVVNPTTGATAGTITWGAIQLAILSALRFDQHAFDAAQDAPPPAPQPAPDPAP
jgi:hypothetical protein